MNDDEKLENLISQMSLKHPTQSLDEKVEQALTTKAAAAASVEIGPRQIGNFNFNLLVAAAALLVGFTIGYVASGFETNQVRTSADNGSPRVATADEPSPEANDGENSPWPTDSSTSSPDASRTKIVDDRMISTADGELLRAYHTVTPKQYRFFDPEANEFRDIEIGIPRIIVTNANGI